MGLFELEGKTIKIEKIPIKVNGTIQEVLDIYKKMFIPNNALIHYLHICKV